MLFVITGSRLSPSGATELVGTATQVRGQADLGIGEEWRPLELGAEVPAGAHVRTGAMAELRVVFRDDTVLDLQERSEVVIERQIHGPAAGTFDSALALIRGSISLHVSDSYNAKGATFLVTSPTASATVLGGDFTFRYDGQSDTTEIAGIRGQVDVHNSFLPEEKGVLITARQATRVARNKPPEPVHVVDTALFQRFMDTVTRAGSDWPVLVWQNNPLLSGHAVAHGTEAHSVLPAPATLPAQSKGQRSSVTSGQDVGSLLGESPAALGSGGIRAGVGF